MKDPLAQAQYSVDRLADQGVPVFAVSEQRGHPDHFFHMVELVPGSVIVTSVSQILPGLWHIEGSGTGPDGDTEWGSIATWDMVRERFVRHGTHRMELDCGWMAGADRWHIEIDFLDGNWLQIFPGRDGYTPNEVWLIMEEEDN